MGFRTTYGGQKGFVTAGHCLYQFNTTIPLGTIKLVQYENNRYGDYGFIATSSSYTPVNDIYYSMNNATLSVTTSIPNIFVGTIILKAGRTTYITRGKLTGVAQTVKYKKGNDYIYIKGLYVSDLASDEGDSGGAVMMPDAINSNKYILVGILSGKSTVRPDVMYFTGLDSMPDAFRTGRY